MDLSAASTAERSAGGVSVPQEAFPERGCEGLAVAVGYGFEGGEFAGAQSHGYLRLPLADIRPRPMLGWSAVR